MKGWKKVLTDKKFWVALIGVVTGMAVALGMEEMMAARIGGSVLSVISVLLYAMSSAVEPKDTTGGNTQEEKRES